MARKKKPETVTITSVVSEDWIAFCVDNTDLFMRAYCGYWLRGVERDSKLGWLAWEDDNGYCPDAEPNRDEALKAWREGRPLPKGWHRLDRAAAVKAWAEGVKRWGCDWHEKGDADSYDYVVQMAILGEQKYA